MSDYICPYLCSYRTNSGFCGYTGGHGACQWRKIKGFNYETKRFYAEPVGSYEEAYNLTPKTNADRIRGMSDEELADFIGGIFTIERDVWGDYDPRTVVTQEPRVEVRDREGMLDWLKSPVEVENGT